MELRAVFAFGDRAHKALRAIVSRRSHLSSSNSRRVDSSKLDRTIDIELALGDQSGPALPEGKRASLEGTFRFRAPYRSLFTPYP